MTAVPFVRFDADGRVTDFGQQEVEFIVEERLSGVRIVGGEGHPATHWVDAGTLRLREPNPAVLDGLAIRALPVPSKVTIGAAAYEVTDGSAELSFALPGTYVVRVDSGPRFLVSDFEVTA